MSTKQLQQIAERCQQGDREAFALLYRVMIVDGGDRLGKKSTLPYR
ncbi:MAG: hypothetical protein ACSW8D_03760 [Prevotella sp.]